MTSKERKDRSKELIPFIGDLVEITLKQGSITESLGDEEVIISNMTVGYVIDVTDFFIFIGEVPEEFNEAIEIDNIVRIRIMENIPEELKIIIPEDENVH